MFTEGVFATAFQLAYDALWNAFLNFQCPRIELLTNVTLPAGTTQITPAQMGISDWGDYIYLSERRFGSNDRYIDLNSVDRLTQRPMTERLIEFNYRNDTFYFVGATNTIDLQVKYDASSEAPPNDATQILVDSSLTFLANYAAGIAGRRKGRDETAAACMMRAVGPSYDAGGIGGALFQLVQPLVRSRQKVQIAPKPYSALRRFGMRFPVPFVAAQQGTTGGTGNAPIQFTTSDGTITPTPDGVTTVFYAQTGAVLSMQVYLNGDLLTSGVDYTNINNQITFNSAPLATDLITVWAYLSFQ